MNTLMLAVIALVAFIYCGGSRVPPVLRQNKDMILGVLVGLVLCSFFGLRLEGLDAAHGGFADRDPADAVRVTTAVNGEIFYVDKPAGGYDAAHGGAAFDSGFIPS